MTRPDLEALITRVEGCNGADREVDAGVESAMFGGSPSGRKGQVLSAFRPGLVFHAPYYTSSLDATIALCERVLPRAVVSMDIFPEHTEAKMALHRHEDDLATADASAPTPALALLLAILKTKLSETTHGVQDE